MMASALRTVLFLASLAAVVVAASGPAAAGSEFDDDVFQCIADCVIDEGEDELQACKTRCAGLRVFLNDGQKDCMAAYKRCKSDCPADDNSVTDRSACHKACKDALMTCY